MRRKNGMAAWYLQAFFYDFVPIYPLYAIMFGEHGISPYGLATLLSLWVVAYLLFEVPSGTLGDKFSRKRLMVVGAVLKALAYVTWLLAQNFGGYLAGFTLWSAGSSLRSGTEEALLYDTLEERGEGATYAKVYGRMSAFRHLAVGLSTFTGGVLIRFGYTTVLVLSIGFMVVAGLVIAVGLSEVPRRQVSRERPYLALLREGVLEAVRNRAILYIVLLTGTLLAIPGALDEYVGPLLRSKGLPKDWVAYVFGVGLVAGAAGNAYGHRLNRLPFPVLLGLFFGVGAALTAAALRPGWPIPAAIILMYFVAAVVHPLFLARLQDAIEGDARATVISVNAMATGVGGLVYLQAYGLVAQVDGFAIATRYTGIAMALIAGVFVAASALAPRGRPLVVQSDSVNE